MDQPQKTPRSAWIVLASFVGIIVFVLVTTPGIGLLTGIVFFLGPIPVGFVIGLLATNFKTASKSAVIGAAISTTLYVFCLVWLMFFGSETGGESLGLLLPALPFLIPLWSFVALYLPMLLGVALKRLISKTNPN